MDASSLFHGGDLSWAAARFGASEKPWLDLSTGINPIPYPVGEIPAAAFERLPDASAIADLCAAAAAYYGALDARVVVATPGTQMLIQTLPRLRAPGRVAVLGPTYGEHAAAWKAAGHQVEIIGELDRATDRDVVVVTNPNNPDGKAHDPARLADLAPALAARGGWLVIDEAFADVAPELSLAARAHRPGIIVLRSFGKFFGLAGVRLGFALAEPALARPIGEALGPWAVSGPAIEIATRAFADPGWTRETRLRLARAAAALDGILTASGLHIIGGTTLFRLVETPDASALFEALGRRGILVRHFPDQPDRLRFGLPPDDAAQARLADALAEERQVTT